MWRSEADATSEADEPLEPDPQLVQHCLQGDGLAWEKLVRLHTRRIYNICYRFTGHRHEAEDLTQETFLRIYGALSKFQPEQGAFTTWMTSVTRRSEEHTSELQSHLNLVCRLLLEKKK